MKNGWEDECFREWEWYVQTNKQKSETYNTHFGKGEQLSVVDKRKEDG